MRQLLQTMINALLSAATDAVVGAEWGQASRDRVAQRNGYRHRDLDTRVGTTDVAIPKLRQERLADAYADAFAEPADDAWDAASGDGLARP